MNKSAKIIYSVIALLILAVPISASADNQNLLWKKAGSLSGWKSDADQSTNQSLYDRLSSAINNYTASFDFQIIRKDDKQNTENFTVKIKRKIIATAYSSMPGQTDNSPFITAAGTFVRDGIVAANFLKFGTKVRFPEVYGDKVFVVEDRMAKRNNYKIDVWMENRSQAFQFGVKRISVEILN